MATVPYIPAINALGHSAPLDYRATFPLLGVPLEVRSNSPAVLAAAERAFGGWRDLEPELIEPLEPCVVSLIVHDDRRPTTDDRRPFSEADQRPTNNRRPTPALSGAEGTDDRRPTSTIGRAPTDDRPRTTDHGPWTLRAEPQDEATDQGPWTTDHRRNAPFTMRVHSNCFLGGDGANLLTAQLDRGVALGFVTPELVADEARLRHHALELLALVLVTQHNRLPVHAGAVVLHGRTALLVGHSMAGKSTLCYAALRAGFGLLAEDVVYVSRGNRLRLWGVPWQIHLLPDAVQRFAELADRPAAWQANGKLKLAVETASFGADRPRRHAEHAAVCIVERAAGAGSALEPIDPAIAVAALSGKLESGFDLYGDTRAVAQELVAGGAYRLMVGSDLRCAVELLRTLCGS